MGKKSTRISGFFDFFDFRDFTGAKSSILGICWILAFLRFFESGIKPAKAVLIWRLLFACIVHTRGRSALGREI